MVNQPEAYIKEGLTEVLGIDHISESSGPVMDTTAQIDSYVASFGLQCTKGLLQRAGRAGLYYWLRDHAESHGWQLPEYRLLSFHQKIKRGLEDITTWVENNSANKFSIAADKDKMVIHYNDEHQFSQVICAYYLGLFQEFLSWTASGKFFQAAEVECDCDKAGSHMFEIRLNPLD